MREVHSKELQPGSLMPGRRQGRGGEWKEWVSGAPRFDVNSLPRWVWPHKLSSSESIDDASLWGSCQNPPSISYCKSAAMLQPTGNRKLTDCGTPWSNVYALSIYSGVELCGDDGLSVSGRNLSFLPPVNSLALQVKPGWIHYFGLLLRPYGGDKTSVPVQE